MIIPARFGLAAAILALVPGVVAQAKTPEELAELRAQKLAKPVFQKAEWVTDYDEARELARKEGKLVFAYFTRSYSP